jgi:hypothetical protein
MKIIIEIEIGENETPLELAQSIEKLLRESCFKEKITLDKDRSITDTKPRKIRIVGIE